MNYYTKLGVLQSTVLIFWANMCENMSHGMSAN